MIQTTVTFKTNWRKMANNLCLRNFFFSIAVTLPSEPQMQENPVLFAGVFSFCFFLPFFQWVPGRRSPRTLNAERRSLCRAAFKAIQICMNTSECLSFCITVHVIPLLLRWVCPLLSVVLSDWITLVWKQQFSKVLCILDSFRGMTFSGSWDCVPVLCFSSFERHTQTR